MNHSGMILTPEINYAAQLRIAEAWADRRVRLCYPVPSREAEQARSRWVIQEYSARCLPPPPRLTR